MFGMVFGPQLSAGQYEPDGDGNPIWMTDSNENGDPVDFEPTEGADWGNEDPDTLPNWLEDYLGTDRYNPDTNGDNLADSDEIYITGTNPTVWDTDGNGVSDGELLDEALEASIGTSDYQTDSDGDGFSDHDEYMAAITLNGIAYSISFNPVVFDSDGVGDMDQWLAQTLPNGDYDGDSQENADEVYSYGTRPTHVLYN